MCLSISTAIFISCISPDNVFVTNTALCLNESWAKSKGIDVPVHYDLSKNKKYNQDYV